MFLPSLLAIGSAIAGCGEQGASSPVAPQIFPGPHDGLTFTFPRESAFVEVVNEGGRGRRANNTAVVAYFSGPDTDLATLPAPLRRQGRAQGWRQRAGRPAHPDPPQGGAPSPSRLATQVGPYAMDGRQCVLTGTLDGRPFRFEFDGSRLR